MDTIRYPSPRSATAAPGRRLAGYVPPWLRSRRALVLGIVAVGVAALALGWPWVAAAGLAPLALTLLPCAMMCAVGLCMAGKDGNESCGQQGGAPTAGAGPPRRDA